MMPFGLANSLCCLVERGPEECNQSFFLWHYCFAVRGGPTSTGPVVGHVFGWRFSLFRQKGMHARVACVFFDRALHILLHTYASRRIRKKLDSSSLRFACICRARSDVEAAAARRQESGM
jgi:hypothetical protein